MPTGHISKRSVDARKPESKDSYLWDDELSGFGLKVTPAGLKVYRVQNRLGGRKGRVRRVTIGVHGRVTPEQARVEAKRLLGMVASGDDPAEQRRDSKSQPTLGELFEVVLSEYAMNCFLISGTRGGGADWQSPQLPIRSLPR